MTNNGCALVLQNISFPSEYLEREREKYSNYNEAAPELMRARRFKLPAMRYPMHSLQPFFMTSCSFVSFFSPRFSPLLHLSLLHPRVLYLLLFARLFTLLNKHPKKEHLLCCSRCLENSFGWTWAFRGSQTMFRVLMRRSPEHHSRHRTVCARWILWGMIYVYDRAFHWKCALEIHINYDYTLFGRSSARTDSRC